MSTNEIASTARRTVLVTGAAGHIGSGFLERFHERYDMVQLDLPGMVAEDAARFGRVLEVDLRDLAEVKRAFQGIDTVVHLAGFRKADSLWQDLLEVNITGTYNVVAAAIAQHCRRIVYASSVHAVSGYPMQRQLREDDPVNPNDLYGVSKVFGEALGRYAAEQEGLSFIALRIGAFQQPDAVTPTGSGWMLQEYCAPDDLYELLVRCIDDESMTFEIFNAASASRYPRLDMSKARERLGFTPSVDAFAMVPAIREAIESAGPLAPRPSSGMRADLKLP
ncbi:MAG: NAD(P)-dependent oxidoreductase [Microbacterium sp.]